MIENELENSRKSMMKTDILRIDELERWFREVYPVRKNAIERYVYLGLPLKETRYALELEAYEKENELNMLKGLPLLPPLSLNNLL